MRSEDELAKRPDAMARLAARRLVCVRADGGCGWTGGYADQPEDARERCPRCGSKRALDSVDEPAGGAS